MKIYMRALVLAFTLAFLVSFVPFESACSKLEQDVLRLHILANSDSVADQELKLEVRDQIIKVISPLYVDVKTKNEAVMITEDNLSAIKNTAKSVIKKQGFDYDVSVKVQKEFFDTRYYDDFTMPAGVYDSLIVNIGEAQGENWWCVMYPCLCVGASSKVNMKEDLSDDEYSVITSGDVVFKFKIVEYFEKISYLLGG